LCGVGCWEEVLLREEKLELIPEIKDGMTRFWKGGKLFTSSIGKSLRNNTV
jgi:hypothetical protein